MRLMAWVGVLAVGSWLATLGACGAFAAPRFEAVVLTYLGDTVLIRGTTRPAPILVTVKGEPLPNPRLVLKSSDTTIIAVTKGGDSLTARIIGKANLIVRVESSILTDSQPTLSQPLRVKT
jgi:hypothetical protein